MSYIVIVLSILIMKTYIISCLIFTASLLTFSCGHQADTDTNIATARSAISNDDFTTALSALNEAQSVAFADSCSHPSDLTEIAALYCIIDEKQQSDDNIVNALRCYELAISIAPDSVRQCFSRLSDDEKCQIDKLDKLLIAQQGNSTLPDSLGINELHDDIIDDIDIIE